MWSLADVFIWCIQPLQHRWLLQHTRLLRHMQSPWHPAVHAASLASADCSTQRPATPKSQKLPPAPLPPVVLKPVTPGRYLSMRAFPWCAREHFLPISWGQISIKPHQYDTISKPFTIQQATAHPQDKVWVSGLEAGGLFPGGVSISQQEAAALCICCSYII